MRQTYGTQLTIEKYTQMVAPIDVRDLDLANAFLHRRLHADVLRCLRYMHDIEMHTICYLRDLLVTSAHRDPEITTFLTFWSFEEYWHGDAIATVLRAHEESAGAARVKELRRTRRVAEDEAVYPWPRLDGGRPVDDRCAHDVGGDQRMDDAGRVRPTGAALQPSRAGRDVSPHHAPRGTPHRLLRRAGIPTTCRQPAGAMDHQTGTDPVLGSRRQ